MAHVRRPGDLSQVLPSPKHFEQAAQLVTPEMTRKAVACGPDPAKQAEQLRADSPTTTRPSLAAAPLAYAAGHGREEGRA